ncbi:hypothetical protein ACFWPH_28270 [Nocardia sp. NPDC058499]|uniref:hypothetical protein n=1 Tax=Nocardia sp. NPDC058499 TaxID=3346530 RepID=UPI003669E503
MSTGRKSAVRARADAKRIMAQRAAQMQAAMQATTEDLAEFLEHSRTVAAAVEKLDAELRRAGPVRDRSIAGAAAAFRAQVERISADETGKQDDGLDELEAAVDTAAAEYRAAALAAARECRTAVRSVRLRQAGAVARIRERGMSVADIGEATGQSARQVSMLLKLASTAPADTEHAESSEPEAALLPGAEPMPFAARPARDGARDDGEAETLSAL